jgi:hypothetical protein
VTRHLLAPGVGDHQVVAAGTVDHTHTDIVTQYHLNHHSQRVPMRRQHLIHQPKVRLIHNNHLTLIMKALHHTSVVAMDDVDVDLVDAEAGEAGEELGEDQAVSRWVVPSTSAV